MTTLELKNKVIGKINQIDNDLILAEVYRLLEDNDEDSSEFQLSDNHINAINIANEQILKGEYLTNEQANNDIDKWLNK